MKLAQSRPNCRALLQAPIKSRQILIRVGHEMRSNLASVQYSLLSSILVTHCSFVPLPSPSLGKDGRACACSQAKPK